jgi:hypothetical protein
MRQDLKAKRVECFAKFCARRQPWTENARSRDGRPPFWERPGRACPTRKNTRCRGISSPVGSDVNTQASGRGGLHICIRDEGVIHVDTCSMDHVSARSAPYASCCFSFEFEIRDRIPDEG